MNERQDIPYINPLCGLGSVAKRIQKQIVYQFNNLREGEEDY